MAIPCTINTHSHHRYNKIDQSAIPTIETVERAAAAKLYIESYFYRLLKRSRERCSTLQPFQSLGDHPSQHVQRERRYSIKACTEQREYHLRKTRALLSSSIHAAFGLRPGPFLENFESLKVLGRGGFGIVRLVRDKYVFPGNTDPRVYAMKVIHKADTLRSCQEGRIWAERDYLIASTGSKWSVPLLASFHDASHLYLMMEFMPGGDFLGLLIRENVLDESTARFYVAEMILCVEEAHRLHFIHRDIKPDNFLISASGHLKISDFGLAFDGHWSHDGSYYMSHRYSLIRKLSIQAIDTRNCRGTCQCVCFCPGKEGELPRGPLRRENDQTEDLIDILNGRKYTDVRTFATSCVGTSQYMAPEIVQGSRYDGRCDWWSIGIILYECLFGHTPFFDRDRCEMRKNIVNHDTTFLLPPKPAISENCRNLLQGLLRNKENRLSSNKYHQRDELARNSASFPTMKIQSTGVRGSHAQQSDLTIRSVFNNDAEDIRGHRWFRNIAWNHIHCLRPPFMPLISRPDDTRFFDTQGESEGCTSHHSSHFGDERFHPAQLDSPQQVTDPPTEGRYESKDERQSRPTHINVVNQLRAPRIAEKPRHPHDQVLQDLKMKHIAIDIRVRTAFLGYPWHR